MAGIDSLVFYSKRGYEESQNISVLTPDIWTLVGVFILFTFSFLIGVIVTTSKLIIKRIKERKQVAT